MTTKHEAKLNLPQMDDLIRRVNSYVRGGQRVGQALYNVLSEDEPDLLTEFAPAGSDIDPFHDNTRGPAFLALFFSGENLQYLLATWAKAWNHPHSKTLLPYK